MSVLTTVTFVVCSGDLPESLQKYVKDQSLDVVVDYLQRYVIPGVGKRSCISRIPPENCTQLYAAVFGQFTRVQSREKGVGED